MSMRMRRIGTWALVLAAPLWLAAQQLESLTYSLKHRDVRSVLARVSEELGPQGQVLIEGSSNRITVKDEPGRLVSIRRLLSELDSPARHFAVTAKLDLLPPAKKNGLFKSAPGFVDMTQWAESVAPSATFQGVMDLYEGQDASCMLGSSYRLYARAQGYDPSRHRLALQNISLSRLEEGKPEITIISGAAVLPEGAATQFLIDAAADWPALRLRTTPTLLPTVSNPEVR
jgi:hypothetical protein